MKEERNIRLRQLVHKLNKVKRSQKKQIDMLCNDILKSHSEFIGHIKNFQFAADFYENILGINNSEQLAKNVGEYFTENLDEVNMAIVFMSAGKPQIYIYSMDSNLDNIPKQIGPYLSPRLVQLVCQTGQVCSVDQLCEMGFFASPAILKKISLAAIGLNKAGPALGMLVVYRAIENPLTKIELARIASVMPGIATALKNMQNVPCGALENGI
ncbi:MAG: hypothetical protein A2Y12_12850 [Planctomycetes bacterium GWF2_42_9]|nr:MAG: hypothetical protein A2Y12_12850 [Planctomycetes bacterium GWF2_42_9]